MKMKIFINDLTIHIKLSLELWKIIMNIFVTIFAVDLLIVSDCSKKHG